MRRASLAVLAAFLLLSCSPEEEPEPSYDPVPDEQLFAEIADLPGVVGEDLEWTDKMGYSNRYGGYVFVERAKDDCRVLDRAAAILRKGRPDATISIQVVPGPPAEKPGAGLSLGEVDSGLFSHPERRYGEQPGDGEPPDDELCRED